MGKRDIAFALMHSMTEESLNDGCEYIGLERKIVSRGGRLHWDGDPRYTPLVRDFAERMQRPRLLGEIEREISSAAGDLDNYRAKVKKMQPGPVERIISYFSSKN